MEQDPDIMMDLSRWFRDRLSQPLRSHRGVQESIGIPEGLLISCWKWACSIWYRFPLWKQMSMSRQFTVWGAIYGYTKIISTNVRERQVICTVLNWVIWFLLVHCNPSALTARWVHIDVHVSKYLHTYICICIYGTCIDMLSSSLLRSMVGYLQNVWLVVIIPGIEITRGTQ